MQSSTSRNESASHSHGLSLSSIKSKASTLSTTRKRPRAPEEWDELDLMICHEEFTTLVALVEKVKVAQERLHRVSRAFPDLLDFYDHHKPSVPKSCLSACEVLAVVERMREQLSFTHTVIRRGSYPVTDATMDDNFSILQKELEFCESCLRNHDRHLCQGANLASPQSQQPSISHIATSPITPSSATTTTPTTTSSTTKYSKWQSDILLQWLVDNHKDPTMSRHDVKELAHRTALTTSQVSTWLQNMKRRRKKNTIDGTKKATHFLDFLFLANERDENHGKLPSSVDGSAYETPKKNHRGKFPARDFIPYTPTPDQICSSYLTVDDDDNFSLNPELLFSGLGTVTESFESLPVDPSNQEDYEANQLLSLFASTWYEVQDHIVVSPTWNSQSSKNTYHHEDMEIHPNLKPNDMDSHEARDDFEGIQWDDFGFSPTVHFRMEGGKIKVDDCDAESLIEKQT